MAKKMKNKKNWYKGISATAITLALAGAALSVPAFAGDVTDTDTTENIPTTGTSSNEKISENVLTETVLSSENVDVDWETPEPSEENNSMVSEGTVTEDELVIGDVTKEETTVETVQPPVYDTEHAESETTQTVNPDGSITETTTTTTPGSQTTETTVSGTITGEIETTPELTEDETSKIEGEITSGIETSISKGEFDWQGMASGSTMTIGDYTVTKNQNGSFTFSKVDSQEGSLSDSDIDKLFGEGYSWNDDGNLVDEDGHVITISGNTATVTTETKVDVTITDPTETGSESVDTDLTISGGTDQIKVNNILQKLENINGSYTYDGSVAEVTKDKDGNITKIVVNGTTYSFIYDTGNPTTSTIDFDNLTNEEIVGLLGDGYSYNEDTKVFTKDNGNGTTSEITFDEVKTTLTKNEISVKVEVTETVTSSVPNSDSDHSFSYTVSSDKDFDSLNDAYEEIINQIAGSNTATIDPSTGRPTTVMDKNNNTVNLTYSEDGCTVTLTTTINQSDLSNDEIVAMLGDGYSVSDDKIVNIDGKEVQVTSSNGNILLTTVVTITANTKEEIVPPETTEPGETDFGNPKDYNWSNKPLDFYIRLDGQIADYDNASSQDVANYTESVAHGKIGIQENNSLSNLPNNNINTWVYQGTVDDPSDGADLTAGEVINSYFDCNPENDKATDEYAIQGAPSDAAVFEKIFDSTINKGEQIYYQRHNEIGDVVREVLTKDMYESNPDHFSIYWYVIKYDESDGFHIDGCIVYNPDPTVGGGVEIKNWYEISGISSEQISGTLTTKAEYQANVQSISGNITYIIPKDLEIAISTPIVTTTNKVKIDYNYQYETEKTIDPMVTITSETISLIEPPVYEPEVPIDTPVIDDEDTPLVETPDEDEEVIEDEDTPLTDAPVETPTEEAVEVIEDNETPLTDAPAVESIDDEVTPLAAAPQTGVTGSAGAAALPFMVAAAAITAFFKRRRNHD